MTIAKRLEGKIAVITGGNSGLGLATAQRFVQEGAYTFITGRRQNELDKVVKQIGKNVMGIQGDVTNLEDLDRQYETVKQQKGRIDILFANAGIAELAPLGSITEAHFDKIFDINVKGLLFTVQKSLPLFQAVCVADISDPKKPIPLSIEVEDVSPRIFSVTSHTVLSTPLATLILIDRISMIPRQTIHILQPKV
jgi:NAD(P)-dependent dehydrogenase (short-subunit alcohol dehydrogenase family)